MSFTLPRVFSLENNDNNNLEKNKIFFISHLFFFFCHMGLSLALLAADQEKALPGLKRRRES